MFKSRDPKYEFYMVQHKSRFKNYLIDPSDLDKEALQVGFALQELKGLLSLAPAEKTLLFVLIYLHQRKGESWMMPSGQQAPVNHGVQIGDLPNLECLKKFKATMHLMDIAHVYRPRLLPQAIFDVLAHWGQEHYDLLLWEKIPTPFEMLEYQANGQRIVTMDLDKAARGELVDGQRDAFEFLLHDLLHADLFFKEQESHLQQKSFFMQLKEIILREKFLETADELFLKDLAYLMSDMNSHRAHLEAQFKAILIQWRLRQEQQSSQAILSAQGLQWVQRVTI